MSRIGKKPIILESNITASFESGVFKVKGPKGELSRSFKPIIEISIKDNVINLTKKRNDSLSKALWGTYASHISNMIEGVNKSFEKKLQVEGIGFRAEVKGDKLVMNLGFSHPVELNIPSNLDVKTEKNLITISGIDKEAVGQFAAKTREIKKPEPYKGKGIRYIDEVVRRKQGKKSA